MLERIKQLQSGLEQGEGYLITSLANRRYVTGFPSSAGMVVITRCDAVFFTDFRYFEKAAKTVTSCRVGQFTGLSADVLPLLREQGITTLYVETRQMSLEEFSRYDRILEGVTLSSRDKLDAQLLGMRSVKSAREIEKIKEAQRMTDQTFSYILEQIQPGRSETDIMLDMEFYLRRLGSEGVAFDFVVVSGKNSSLPHGVPTQKKLEQGDFLTMDFGGVVDGYRSDMTRTVAIGGVSEQQRRVYETVLTAKNKAIRAIAPGKVCKDIDAVARDYIHGAGYEGCFGHGLGHSVGLEIHEDPSFNTRCETLLQPGMIITVEPGIYLEDQFGVRIEDMIVVTHNGCENLTQSTDQLIII